GPAVSAFGTWPHGAGEAAGPAGGVDHQVGRLRDAVYFDTDGASAIAQDIIYMTGHHADALGLGGSSQHPISKHPATQQRCGL
ncbi:hypothetical protein NVV43_28575, partial [Escherichia marmotae]|nr:hypothetical protein [Escherichia marmotae]